MLDTGWGTFHVSHHSILTGGRHIPFPHRENWSSFNPSPTAGKCQSQARILSARWQTPRASRPHSSSAHRIGHLPSVLGIYVVLSTLRSKSEVETSALKYFNIQLTSVLLQKSHYALRRIRGMNKTKSRTPRSSQFTEKIKTLTNLNQSRPGDEHVMKT